MKRALCGMLALAGCGSDDAPAMHDASAASDASGMATWSKGTAVAGGPIQETAAVALGGKIYVIGGFATGGGIVASMQVYDAQSESWSDGPALPMAIHHANAATDGTRIYITGALSGANFTPIGNVYSIAPATETTWTAHAPMLAGRERGAAVTTFAAGQVYVVGGFRGGQASVMADAYSPQTNTWQALADLPGARDHACGGTVDDNVVVAGGRTGSLHADVWSYAAADAQWVPRAAMPTARAGMGCGVIDDVLYTTGGEGNAATPTGVFANVEAFELATNTWTELAPMPLPKHGVGGATWGGALYLAGGADVEAFGAIADVDVFRP